MIPLVRSELDPRVMRNMATMTAEIRRKRSHKTRVAHARHLWQTRRGTRKTLKRALIQFAPGRARCMYCGDNEGSDVDHHDPLARMPLSTFSWDNHLLACSVCNSQHKRDVFPVDADGQPLLLDPTVDDPFEHLVLALSVGSYLATTPRGEATLKICGLNRDLLTRGRQAAYESLSSLLLIWHDHDRRGNHTARTAIEHAIREQPFADVLHAMIRYADAPGAEELFADRLHVLEPLHSSTWTTVLRA
ncbi:HNH endonuclease [Amycolatopsis sp. MtRt-6]|uniref:HNH endonuclease n=1 Tax=Amycolatopsis sp. MtRt-6 TaxID=2792782 RepID=UPI001A8FB132|nr:HNH endonuclease signature motif containing protein [Amycolatopsis sp. MtRt-6]